MPRRGLLFFHMHEGGHLWPLTHAGIREGRIVVGDMIHRSAWEYVDGLVNVRMRALIERFSALRA